MFEATLNDPDRFPEPVEYDLKHDSCLDLSGSTLEYTDIELDELPIGSDIENPFIPVNEIEYYNKLIENAAEDGGDGEHGLSLNSVVVKGNILKSKSAAPVWMRNYMTNDVSSNTSPNQITQADAKELKESIKNCGKYSVPRNDYASWRNTEPMVYTDQCKSLNCVGLNWYDYVKQNEEKK